MQIKSLIAILASAAIGAQAFDYKNGNGVYVIMKDDNGVEYAKFIEPLNTTAPADTGAFLAKGKAGPVLSKRANLGCNGSRLNPGETDAANNALQNYCGTGRRYYSSKIAFYNGGVVAYSCDYEGGLYCYRDESSLSNREITGRCGSYVAGWRFNNQKTYGYDTSNAGFCGNL